MLLDKSGGINRNLSLLILAVIIPCLIITSANAIIELELQGPVANLTDGSKYSWGPQEFDGFFYDLDKNLGEEKITINISSGNCLEAKTGIVYETKAQKANFDFKEWGQYWTIAFLGQQYFAGYDQASQLFDLNQDNLIDHERLSKVLRDDGEESHVLKKDGVLPLDEGYSLTIMTIDSNKAWIVIYKNNIEILEKIVGSDETLICSKDLGKFNASIIAIHFQNIFGDIAEIDGIWQISDHPIKVEEGQIFNRMKIEEVNGNSMKIKMTNPERLPLLKNKKEPILGNIKEFSLKGDFGIRTSDQTEIENANNPIKFYIYKDAKDYGKYMIHGNLNYVKNGKVVWNADNFSGFYYDFKDGIKTEELKMNITDGYKIDNNNASYVTKANVERINFDKWGKFKVIGFLGEKYFCSYAKIPKETSYLYNNSNDMDLLAANQQIAEVLLDRSNVLILHEDDRLNLTQGYQLEIKAIDLKGNKVFVELYKNQEEITSRILEPSKMNATMQDQTFIYKSRIGNIADMVTIAVHFDNAFTGDDGKNITTVDGIWQLSDSPINVNQGKRIDKMNIVNSNKDMIIMNNEDSPIMLPKNNKFKLMGDIGIKIANQEDNPSRFYIYKEMNVEGHDFVVRSSPSR